LNYQSSWLDKAKRLPQEILSRLDLNVFASTVPDALTKQTLYRVLIAGKGTEFFILPFNTCIDQSKCKIFVSTPNSSQSLDKPQNNLIYLKGQSAIHLSSLPPETFDLIIYLWSSQPSHNIDFISLLTGIRRLLKKKGQFCIVTYLDGSPELPMTIMKNIVKYHKNWSLKMYKSTLPESAAEFRKMLNKANLDDVRIWKDNIICDYLNAEEVYNDIFVIEEGLFSDTVPSQYVSIIKEEFIRELKNCSFPLKITYDFVGASSI
jgi:SAM-dependent methyltransferase